MSSCHHVFSSRTIDQPSVFCLEAHGGNQKGRQPEGHGPGRKLGPVCQSLHSAWQVQNVWDQSVQKHSEPHLQRTVQVPGKSWWCEEAWYVNHVHPVRLAALCQNGGLIVNLPFLFPDIQVFPPEVDGGDAGLRLQQVLQTQHHRGAEAAALQRGLEPRHREVARPRRAPEIWGSVCCCSFSHSYNLSQDMF